MKCGTPDLRVPIKKTDKKPSGQERPHKSEQRGGISLSFGTQLGGKVGGLTESHILAVLLRTLYPKLGFPILQFWSMLQEISFW